MDANNILLICLSVALLLLFLYINYKSKLLNGRRLIDAAVSDSSFNPTIFKIYDRSTETLCDRLIDVQPFGWYIWACRGELYILNPEGGMKCSLSSTPAVQVHANKVFVNTCITIPFQSLLTEYRKQPAVHVPYEITSNKFTILSALNILVKGYVKIDGIGEKGNLKSLVTINDHHQSTEINDRPIVTERELIASTGGSRVPKRSSLYLQRQYAAHMSKY